jgi:hypothetical protein
MKKLTDVSIQPVGPIVKDVVVYEEIYRRFGTTYWSHRQRCSLGRTVVTDVSGQPIGPIARDAV